MPVHHERCPDCGRDVEVVGRLYAHHNRPDGEPCVWPGAMNLALAIGEWHQNAERIWGVIQEAARRTGADVLGARRDMILIDSLLDALKASFPRSSVV